MQKAPPWRERYLNEFPMAVMKRWQAFRWAFGRAWHFARADRYSLSRQQTRAYDRRLEAEFVRWLKAR